MRRNTAGACRVLVLLCLAGALCFGQAFTAQAIVQDYIVHMVNEAEKESAAAASAAADPDDGTAAGGTMSEGQSGAGDPEAASAAADPDSGTHTADDGGADDEEDEDDEDYDSEEDWIQMQASELAGLSDEDVIAKVGPLFTADQRESGILASVSLAQFILESGYGKSELAQCANNCFGMKVNLSGNDWEGSAWDGWSVYTKRTSEQNPDGSHVSIIADFRKYGCVEESIADHSAYLNGAMNGNHLRYEGLKDCIDYGTAFQILKDGGYATSHNYVQNLCKIVERYNLTQYDAE